MRFGVHLAAVATAAAACVMWPAAAGAEVANPERASARTGAKAPTAPAPAATAGQAQVKTAAVAPAPGQPKPKVSAAAPVAPRAKAKPAVTTLHATIDLTQQRMVVKANGRTLHSWKISSGRSGHETPTGSFRPKWMAKDWYSRTYDMAPMPYAVFFNGGIATHGTTAVGRLGRPASHGCIRLQTANARTFYNLVRRHGRASTRIVVTGRARQAPANVARRKRPLRTYRVTRPRQPRTYRMVRPGGYGYGGYYAGRVQAPPPRLVYPGDSRVYGYSRY